MQFGLVSVLALASTITGVVSAPVAVQKRATFDPTTFANQLASSVGPKIASLEKTVQSVDVASPQSDINSAMTLITTQVSSIQTEVTSAVSTIPLAGGAVNTVTGEASSVISTVEGAAGSVTGAVGSVEGIANVGGISQIVGSMISEVSGVADDAIKVFGLDSVVSAFGPLAGEMSSVVSGLESVVPGLQSEVSGVLGGLLPGGLSAGLPGINL